MAGSDQGFLSKKAALVYGLNALLVGLCLLLCYRILAPGYERKENTSVNKLGIFHTQLAAERLGARLGVLREELRDNGMRLVDPTRGPVALDPSRWLWLRIQDRDWRAPKFLDPFPAARTDIDSWALNAEKNSFTLTERVPIMKDGVQDFVLVEGGIKPSVLNDLQSEADFGLWIFDLEAYKKGGLGGAKMFERPSSAGALAKDELKLLTSDLLAQVFEGQVETLLPGELPWALYFKNASGPSRLGILGYWVPQGPALNLGNTWLSLGIALLLLSLLASYLLLKFSDSESEPYPAPPLSPQAVSVLPDSAPPPPNYAKATVSFDGVLAWINRIIDQLKDPLGEIQDKIELAISISARPDEESRRRLVDNLQMARSEVLRSRGVVDQISSLSGRDESKLTVLDVEMFYRHFATQNKSLPPINTFFDPDIWKVEVDPSDLGLLFRIYIRFLQKQASPENQLHLSVRLVTVETEDPGAMELKRSPHFKVPFVRISFHLPTSAPWGRAELAGFFDLSQKKESTAAEVELPLSLKIVERMGGRLKIKSNFEDGNVLTLDFPASEERKAEDKVNAKQFAPSSQHYVHVPSLDSGFVSDTTDPGVRAAKALAATVDEEGARSRFRIRKPGEKE